MNIEKDLSFPGLPADSDDGMASSATMSHKLSGKIGHFLNEMNAESELNINAGGDSKIQAIIEHASNGDKTFDEIMDEWNTAWSDAQESNGIEVTE